MSAPVEGATLKAYVNCPAAWERYSTNTLLLDLLLDTRSADVLERQGILKGLSSVFLNKEPPTLTAIITPRWLQTTDILRRSSANTPQILADLDRQLLAIPITRAAAERRCARYDQAAPILQKPPRRPAILVFEKVTGYRDGPSIDAAHRALNEIAGRRGWSIAFTENGAAFNTRQLRDYDAVVWNNVSGDALTIPQRRAFQKYITQGGGFAGVHGSAGDFTYLWDWFRDELIGARFVGHPLNPQFQSAKVVVESSNQITASLAPDWTMTEEWYSFASSPRATGARILARLDESTYNPARLAMGDHPIAWVRCVASGRSFYSAIGHRPESYSEPNSRKLLEQGIAWAAGLGDTECLRGRENRRAR